MSRRTTGLVALGAGAFLLTLALMLRLYAVPALEHLPTDEWSRQIAVSTGPATVLDGTGQEVSGVTVTQDQTIKGEDPQPSDKPGHTVVWDTATKLEFSQKGRCAGTDPVADSTCFLLSSTYERTALDDHSGLADGSWLGDLVEPSQIDASALHHSGYIWKFPFHMGSCGEKSSKPLTIPLFDTQTGKSYPATCQGVEKVKGPGGDSIKTYKFVQDLPKTEIGMRTDIPLSLIGEIGSPGQPVPMWYEKDKTTVWIDPVSGLPIQGTQEVQISVRDLAGTEPRLILLDATLHLDQLQKTDTNDVPVFSGEDVNHFPTGPVFVNYTDQSIRDAKRIDRILLLRDTVPLYAGGGGVVLLALGVVLLWSAARRQPAGPAEKAAEPLEPVSPTPGHGEV